MAALTTSYQRLGQAYLGTSGGSLYIRVYAKYSEQDITNNRTKVQYQARAYYENGSYIRDDQGSGSVSGTSASTVSGSCTYPTTGETTIATTEAWVSHNSDGTKSISCSAYLNFPNWGWSAAASGSASLPTIPRASSISGGSGNIGEETTINISRASSSFTHTISYTFGSLTGTIATKTSSISLPWVIPTDFYSQIPNSNSGTGTLTCDTYSGNTKIGTKTCSFTVKVINSNPTFTDFSYKDGNTVLDNGTTILSLTGDENKIIKGYSTLKVTISSSNKAVAQNQATMLYYQINDTKVDYSDTDDIVFELPKYNDSTITLLAVDSRGNSTSVTKEITQLINYEDLIKGTISLSRSDNGVGESVTLSFNGNFWNNSFGTVTNEVSAIYKYKKTVDTEYTTGTTQLSLTKKDNTYSFNGLIIGDTTSKGFDINDSYDFIVEVTDKISKVIYTYILGTGSPALAIYKNKASIGNKYDTRLGGTQLWGDIFVNGESMLDYEVIDEW